MINKSLSLLLMAFAMTANFCLAQDNIPSNASQNQEQPALEDVIVSLHLKKNGHTVTLTGADHEISLQKGQHLMVNMIGDLSDYTPIYGEPENCPIAAAPVPSIYYRLSNPWSAIGFYDSMFRIPVLKELNYTGYDPGLFYAGKDPFSFHFLASNPGTEKVTVNVFDDTGSIITDGVQAYTYDTVASYTLTVTVK